MTFIIVIRSTKVKAIKLCKLPAKASKKFLNGIFNNCSYLLLRRFVLRIEASAKREWLVTKHKSSLREREREMPGYEALTVESFVLKYRKTKANLVLPLK